MKQSAMVFIIITFLLIPLTSCVSSTKFEALENNFNELQTKYTELEKNLEFSEGQIQATANELTSIKSESQELVKSNTSLESEVISLNSTLENLQSEYDVLGEKFKKLEKEHLVAKAELNKIKQIYPIKRFSDADALENWLANQPNPPSSTDAILWLSHALKIQEKALEDGYIINVELYSLDDINYSVFCSAILEDDSYYWWDPETDDIFYALNVRHF